MLKSIIGNLKSIIGSGLEELREDVRALLTILTIREDVRKLLTIREDVRGLLTIREDIGGLLTIREDVRGLLTILSRNLQDHWAVAPGGS